MTIREKWKLAEDAARRAGEKLVHRRDFVVHAKAVNDYVTEADVEAEKLIRGILLSACPEDGFFGEETGSGGFENRDGRFIVDPIDGTTNFVRNIPQYAVSIAYERGGELLFGAVYNPAQAEMFTAFHGEGAWLNGEPIRVSCEDAPARSLIGMSFAHRNAPLNRRMMGLLPGLSEKTGDLRRLGSAALDLCYVACGRIDGFIELGLNLYDIAAGVLIAREAGATCTGWPGEEDLLTTGNVLAATPKIHRFLHEYLGEH